MGKQQHKQYLFFVTMSIMEDVRFLIVLSSLPTFTSLKPWNRHWEEPLEHVFLIKRFIIPLKKNILRVKGLRGLWETGGGGQWSGRGGGEGKGGGEA